MAFISNSKSTGTKSKGLLIIFMQAFTFTCLFFLFTTTRFSEEYETVFQRSFHRLQALTDLSPTISNSLVILKITERDYPASLARSPINRSWLAELLEKTGQKSPKAIFLNILLDRPTNQTDDKQLAKVMKQLDIVYLRNEPSSALMPVYSKAAKGTGTVRLRHDLDGYVHSICASNQACENGNPIISTLSQEKQLSFDWLKLQYNQKIPFINVSDLGHLSADALKEKVVLIGVDFKDLYPPVRVPSDPLKRVNEIDLIASALEMDSSGIHVSKIHLFILFFIAFSMILFLGILFKQHLLSGWFGFFISAFFTYFSGAFLFIRFQLEYPVWSLIIILFLFSLYTQWNLIHLKTLNQLQLELHLKENKISLLSNELHQHHLFNEFSRLSVMITHAPSKAKEYLIEFAELLRISLKNADQHMVNIKVQIDYLRTYIRQQSILFEDRIEILMDVPEKLPELSLPWQVFYPFVENAVKYTESYIKEDGGAATIKINLSIEDKYLHFEVLNPYKTSTTTVSTGKGLKNLQERLLFIYKKEDFSIINTGEKGEWRASLKLTLKD